MKFRDVVAGVLCFALVLVFIGYETQFLFPAPIKIY